MTILSVENITRKFGALTAVDNVSLEIEEGEIRGLIGPNGAGKTTLFNLISGFDKPTRGTVRFRNRYTTGLKPSEIVRMGLVRTFQLDTTFKEMTVLQNVMLAQHLRYGTGFLGTILKTKSYKREHSIMVALAEEIVDSCGLTSLKGELARKLPHGNQRVLGLAIALSAKPSLLCLDEPSAGLTPEETGSLMSKLREVNKQGVTLIIVEHNMRVIIPMCDRISVLSFGRKIADGPPGEVVTNKDVIESYLGADHANT